MAPLLVFLDTGSLLPFNPTYKSLLRILEKPSFAEKTRFLRLGGRNLKMRTLESNVFRFTLCTLLWVSFLVGAESKQLADYPNQLTRDGELVILPEQGTVYIATDFHAHWSDFNQWLKQTKLIERIASGEDVYGLILGDVADHKPGDKVFESSGGYKDC